MAKEKRKKRDARTSKKEKALTEDISVDLGESETPVSSDSGAETVAEPVETAPEVDSEPAPVQLKASVEALAPGASKALHEIEANLPAGPAPELTKRKRAAAKRRTSKKGDGTATEATAATKKPAAKKKTAVKKKPAAKKKAVADGEMKPEAAKSAATKSSARKTPAKTPRKAITRKTPMARTPLTADDVYLFREGTHRRIFEKLGAHVGENDGVKGTFFGVWAPSARSVSVIGDFNDWDPEHSPLELREGSGIWEGFIPGIDQGDVYKYNITSVYRKYDVDKADPFAFKSEVPPANASVVWKLDYKWRDGKWMKSRAGKTAVDAPMSIYEIHLGSWRRVTDDEGRSLTYRELADTLPMYLKKLGFTHVEFMPVQEHPYYPSWGYQATGFFAATSRYGDPEDLMYLVDKLHQAGIGVIVDWVPSHFPMDGHGLSYFDGTHLFEPADPRRGYHPDWKSMIFDYGRPEVRSFLISSAIFWLEKFHVDALRVDAVASMLYLDYSREEGEWIPNQYGGRENLDAIVFLRKLNEAIYTEVEGAVSIAEESTSWPLVSRPTYVGGLGFGFKWDMGWMHDTLEYFKNDPINRKYHHNTLTFRQLYANSENFILSLSHDEVVHMKGSLIGKMTGDPWQKFANLRLLYAYMYSQSGKKLLFMGSELAQAREWSHEGSLDWHLLGADSHAGIQRFVEDLNGLYKKEPALWELDSSHKGFEWIDCNDWEHSIVVIMRRGKTLGDEIVIALNFTPIARHGYRIGLPRNGDWTEILNSDSEHYWGGGVGNMGTVMADETPHHGRPASMEISLPPLGAVFFKNLGPWVDVANQSEPENADPTEPWDMDKVKKLDTNHDAKSKE